MAKTTDKDDKSWKDTISKIEKDFGKGSIIGATEKPMEIEAISTGSLDLDKATGVNGYPEGRIIEIYGPESSGKTTLCLHAIAEGQKKHPEMKFVFVDVEHSLDIRYAEALGVDLKNLEICQSNSGEEALEVSRRLMETKEAKVVVIDSVASLLPQSEIDGEIGDSSLGKQARLMSQSLRLLAGIAERTKTLLIFTNQIREKIGVMFGSPETTSGGNALKFYATMRLDIRKKQTNKESSDKGAASISNTVVVKLKKNKVAPPFTEAEFDIVFGVGIDKTREILREAVEQNIIVKSGSFYSYNDNRLGQGEQAVLELVNDNEELRNEIFSKLVK
jgi:recombination protein RecA